MTESKICTCPSGDGSLVHPCPAHPAVEQVGGDERAAFELFVRKHCGMPAHIAVNWDAKFTNDAWEGWKARAALAQPSQSQYEASFEEWLANELEGEDGQPVPAAVCDIALARRAFNHWPKLEQPAKVGGVRFSAGVSSRLVVEAAQRLYEFESTPEKEAERPEVAEVAFVLRNIGAMDAEDIDGDNVDLRFEDAEGRDTGCDVSIVEYAEKAADLFEQHDRIVGALRAEITQLRQHKNDYMDAGQETYRALQNEIREREAEIARLDGLVSGRTAERDAALAEVERLRESKGDPVGSLEKCMKVMYERDEHAKRLEVALARVAELERELRDEENAHITTIEQRDNAEHWADQLAKAIAERFGVDIGEHSNLNCPWNEALVWMQQPPAQAQHSVPEGWMLVPVEQLLNMMSDKDHDTRIMAERQLLAVLAAAPGKEGV